MRQGRIQRLDIERARPRARGPGGDRLRPPRCIGEPVDIVAAQRRESRIELDGNLGDGLDAHVVGQHLRQTPDQRRRVTVDGAGVQRCPRDVEMGDLSGGMHSSVGSPGDGESHRLAQLVVSVSVSTPATVRRPGCRAHPEKSSPVVTDLEAQTTNPPPSSVAGSVVNGSSSSRCDGGNRSRPPRRRRRSQNQISATVLS